MQARILFALLLVLPMVASAQAYKCKRPDGKLSFQDQPCDEGSKGEPLIISDPSPASLDAPAPQKGKPMPSRRDKIPGAPNPAVDESLKERNRQLEAQNRATECNAARRNLQVLQTQRPVYSTDKNGNRQYVEDSDRQSTLAAAQQRVSETCS